MKGKLHRLRILRNKVIHPKERFSEDEAIELFETVRKLSEKLKMVEIKGGKDG